MKIKIIKVILLCLFLGANPVQAQNNPPVANAGADISSILEFLAIGLDGTVSFDPDGDSISFSWAQISGTPALIFGPASSTPTVILPDVPAGGDTLVFELTVTDPGGLFSTDTMDITVRDQTNNSAPIPDAGPNQTVTSGATVQLDASGSTDPDGDLLVFTWNQTAGPAVVLSNVFIANPDFTAPVVAGPTDVTFEVSVSDSLLANTASVTITINPSASTGTGSDFYDYTIIAESDSSPLNDGDFSSFHPDISINENGEIAFSGSFKEGASDTAGKGIFKGVGGSLTPIWTNMVDPNIAFTPSVLGLGINDDGTIAFQAQNLISGQFPIYLGDGGPLVEFNSPTSIIRSVGINNNGQIPFYAGDLFVLSDGVTAPTLGGLPQSPDIFTPRTNGFPVINDENQGAFMSGLGSGGGTDYSIFLYELGETPQQLTIGNSSNWGALSLGFLGFNNAGAVSFSSDGPLEKKVVFANETGISTVAEVNDVFSVFTQGTSLNDFNVVAFRSGLVSGGDGVFVGFPNFDPSLSVISTNDFIDGKSIFQISELSTRSLNNKGQVALHVVFDDLSENIVRADPKPGVTPGTPILPSNDISTGDPFELVICGVVAGTGQIISGFRCFFDPPIATGYDYWVNDISPNIESVLIPAPLPQGDDTFEVVFGSHVEVLSAMTPFFFTDFVPEGVREFTIRGIDEAEMLSPTDGAAFVTGLTFVEVTAEGSILFMDPIVEGEEVDNIPPVVTPPADIIVQATGTLTAVDIGTATAIDNVGVVSGPSPSTTGPFPLGTTTIVWTASDAAGNIGTATQNVTVTATGFDLKVFWARAKLRPGPSDDKFKVRGNLILDAASDGIDPVNESVTFTLGTFSETISSGSFVRKNNRWVYKAPQTKPFSGIKQMVLRDNGKYKIKVKGIDLSGIDFSNPVLFSIQVANDRGEFMIPFDNSKPRVKKFVQTADHNDEDDELDEDEFE